MRFSEGEIIIHEIRPAPRLIAIWFFSRCIVQGLAAAFLPAMALWLYISISGINKGIVFEEHRFIFSICILLFGIGTSISYIYHRYLIGTISYFITDRRCIFKGGIARRVEHSVSCHKITDVERSQNILEQLLSLSTINLFTPGTASMRMGAGARSQPIPELRFEGLVLSEVEAETINEQIRMHAKS